MSREVIMKIWRRSTTKYLPAYAVAFYLLVVILRTMFKYDTTFRTDKSRHRDHESAIKASLEYGQNVTRAPLSKEEMNWQKQRQYFKLRTERVNPQDFKISMTAPSMNCAPKRTFLLIMCLSRYGNYLQRLAIRNTWGSVATGRQWPNVNLTIDDVRLVFVLGRSRTAMDNQIALGEHGKFGDIVQADFEDSYQNLTIKVLTGLKWVKMFCPNAEFILKVDDDTFIHVFNLMTFLKQRVNVDEKGLVIGYVCDRAEVLRTGFKWAVSNDIYPMTYYPPYSFGNMYVISGNIVSKLYESAEYMPYISIEDAFVTGILRVIIGAYIWHYPEFAFHDEPRPFYCSFQNTFAIASTKVSSALARDIWEALHKKDVLNCRYRRGSGLRKTFATNMSYLFDRDKK